MGPGEETWLEQKTGQLRWGEDNKGSVCEKNPSAGRIGPQRGFLSAQGKAESLGCCKPGGTVSHKRSKVPRLPTWIQATRGPAAPPRPRPAVSLTTVTSRPGRGRRVCTSCYATAG